MAGIIVAFVGQLSARVADMRQAQANGDWDSLRRWAHQMKGAGGGYGYSQLTDEARELETLAKQKDVEAATLSLNRLGALCRRIEAGCPAGGARSHNQ